MPRLLYLFAVAAFSLSFALPLRADTLPVPANLIPFDSTEGEKLLVGAEATKAYFALSEQFVTQQNQAFCGVASLVMVLNALKVPAPASEELAPFSAFDQSNIFTAQAEAVLPRTVIEENGMTLDQLGALAKAFGLKAAVRHASDTNLDAFRRDVRARLETAGQYVIVNYLRSALGQQKYGHISPLAAYDADSDRFLILDVSRYKYPPVWVTASDLFAAMNTPDRDNDNRSRGFLEISR
ncbi:phytochelatin synthase family protein [Dongia soli]|uniref:glutathione gamma-glutamylcysteinyltransferase n=1 Tax=Dongia soli TaxID=600628 RepID=A0ABU5EIF4_9PROT|nr:phytochelatin synthase family protein [Dongia soli]MDY0885622.1 phytochelatin synthase family protein [Dongia soli]